MNNRKVREFVNRVVLLTKRADDNAIIAGCSEELADLIAAEVEGESRRCKEDTCSACAGQSFPNVKGYRIPQGPNEANNFVHRATYGNGELHTLCGASGIWVREHYAALRKEPR